MRTLHTDIDPSDFNLTETSIIIQTSGNRPRPFVIPILIFQDGLLEETIESISLELAPAVGERGVVIMRGEAQAEIIDSDGE